MSCPQLFALLVGINEYKSPGISDLRGCANDAKAIYGFLTQRIGMPTANIRLLTSTGEESSESLPSRKNMINGWMWMIDQASSGDQVFFHYSGHGAQAKSVDPNEPDGYDETLVPFDSRENDGNGSPVYDILDKELATLIEMAEAKGALVTVVLDCCHAGSGTRALVPVRKTRGDKRARPIETLLPGTRQRTERAATRFRRPRSGWKIGTGHVLLAGCRDEEMSHEYRSPVNGVWYGAMTFFLLQKLQELRPQMTWQEIHDMVQTKVNGIYARQIPQLEGPGNRVIFGGITPSAGSYLNVTDAKDAGDDVLIRIGGGAAVGLTPGSQVELYPAGSDAMQEKGLGRGEVLESKVDYAYTLINGVRKADFSLPARAKVTAYGYEDLTYEVATEDPLLRAALTTTHASPFLRVVEAGSPFTRFHVLVEDDAYVIQDGSGAQIVWETPPRTQVGAAKTAENLHHLATFNNVRALRNPSPMVFLEDALRVEAHTYTRASFTAPKDGEFLGKDGMLPPGRKLWVSVRNESAENLYVTVFNLSAHFGIHRVYPERAPYQLVVPGKGFFIRDIEPGVDDPYAESSIEILKVFATRVPTSFDVLEMPNLNEPDTTDKTRAFGPLAELMNGIRYDGSGSRNLVVRRDDTHDRWITKQVAITVLKKPEICVLPAGKSSIEVGSPLDISLEKPAELSGQLVVSNLINSTWDAEDPISLPPGLDNPDAAAFFEPLTFSETLRAIGASPGVLTLDAEANQLRAISAESPLRVELSLKDEPDLVGLLPIAFDGEYYYVAGHPADAKTTAQDVSRRRMAVEITHLPTPDDSGSGDDVVAESPARNLKGMTRRLLSSLHGKKRLAELDARGASAGADEGAVGELPSRDLKHMVRLFLYKIIYRERPPDLGVRKVRCGIDGIPVYSKVTPKDMAQTHKALLITHGFASSTEQLAQRSLASLLALDDYDLALAFDYESLNTGIHENGRLLTDELRGLGFGAAKGPSLDIFCHSMGTQIARVCIEMEGGHEFVERVFMSGAHNTGTPLAEAHRLVPWLATILINQAGLVQAAPLAQMLAMGISHLITGLRDLAPSAKVYRQLNDQRTPVDVKYYIQIGVNSDLDGPVNWRKLFSKTELMRILDKGLDQVLGPNDLLVGVGSAHSVRGGHWPGLRVDVLSCNHFEYFHDEESLAALRRQFR